MTFAAPRLDAASTAGTGASAPGFRLLLGLLVTGFCLIQLAWLLTIPPYRGVDEFDHAYRAASVARGEYVAPVTAATRGTGAFVSVPADIVAAAGPQCSDLSYTSAVDCEPSADLGDGMVSVASGAGRYNPVYYAVVGTAALPFDGYNALYAMRLATIAICAALFGAAAWSLLRWAQGPLAILGLVVATSPVLIYSTAVVAGNGVEMTAALAVWTGLWGLLRDKSHVRGHLVVATIGACTLVTVRSLGPLWLLLVVLALLVAAGPRRQVLARLGELARWRPAVVATIATASVAVAGFGWTLAMRSLVVSHETVADTGLGYRLSRATAHLILWVFQSVAAFPTRSEPAPTVVYATGLVAFLALGIAALLWARGRLVAVAAVVAALSLIIPFAVTVATYASFGAAWQGRYTLPLSVGIPLLLVLALDRRLQARAAALTVVAAVLLLGIAHTVSVAEVTAAQRVASPLVGTGHWLMPPVWLVSVLAATGVLLMCWAAWRRRVGADERRVATVAAGSALPAQT